MVVHTVGLALLLVKLRTIKQNVKHTPFAYDLTGAGKVKGIKTLWETLIAEGPKDAYHLKIIH